MLKDDDVKVESAAECAARDAATVKQEQRGDASDNDNDNNNNSDNDNHEDDVDSDGEPVNWWERDDVPLCGRGEKRWDTLSHNGVLFPPPYVPHGIPIRYDGEPFALTPEEEEVATMFAVMREHDYYRNDTFRRNFFRSWREILDKRTHPIRRLELCDFDAIYQWHLREREKKLAMTKEEKKQQKLAAAAEAEPYRFCLWDGRKEEVARYRVEPPGLFRGRGKHPLMGRLKQRVQPEDITINIGEDAVVPSPPPGHHWAAVQHDHTVTWLAMWRDNVGGNFKYVMPAASSTIKGQSDMLKFEKARKLKEHIGAIQAAYTRDFASKDMHTAQRAVAMYFIDKLALRVGNEKGSDEADTVGCCSLRYEHVQLLPGNVVKFDFLGKDSIRYQNEVTVLPEVYTQLVRFTRGKRRGDDIFDQLTPTQLNDYLKSFMDGLSAKVFRTYNASITLHRWFCEKPVDPHATVADKLAYFNKANTEVAILCNHQKSVPKNFSTQMMQLTTKAANTRALLAQLEQARQTMRTGAVAEAVTAFFAEQDRIQYEWLAAYGSEDDKKEYDEIVAKRDSAKATARAMAAAAAAAGGGGGDRTRSRGGSRHHRSHSRRHSGDKDTTTTRDSRSRSRRTRSKKATRDDDGDDGSNSDDDNDGAMTTTTTKATTRRAAATTSRRRTTAKKASTTTRRRGAGKRTQRRGTTTTSRTRRRDTADDTDASDRDSDDDGGAASGVDDRVVDVDNTQATTTATTSTSVPDSNDDESNSSDSNTTASSTTRKEHSSNSKGKSTRTASSSSRKGSSGKKTTAAAAKRPRGRRHGDDKNDSDSDDDDDDTPLSQLAANVGSKRTRNGNSTRTTTPRNGVAAKTAASSRSSNNNNDVDDDDVPLSLL